MTGDDTHIGREHVYARSAMYERARRVIAERRCAESTAGPQQGVPAAAPTGQPAPARQRPPARGSDAPIAPTRPDPDEDLDFLDGRWTSDSW